MVHNLNASSWLLKNDETTKCTWLELKQQNETQAILEQVRKVYKKS